MRFGIALLLMMFLSPAWGQGSTAFVAVPDSMDGKPLVDAGERISRQVKISQYGSQFLWASNKNVPLTRLFKGDKIIFVADGGEGMIVVLNQSNLPENLRKGDKRPFLYCEHFRVDLGVKSYCGGSQEVAVSQ